MARNQAFYPTPVGAKTSHIPESFLADSKTSAELIPDNLHDAFYFRSLEEQGTFLNEPQIEAVKHVDHSLLILAGAGSGKTRVLVSRTGYLVTVKEVDPKEILLITFTRKAADEMKERIAQLPGLSNRMAKDITAGTFHSIFLRVLRDQGYQQKILSNDKQKEMVIKIILKNMDLQDSYEPETILSLLSSYKNQIIPLEEMVAKTPNEKELKRVFQRFEEWKMQNHYLDFDDILMETYQLFKRNESVLKTIQERFKYIMVDEFQDTNLLQYALIKMVAQPRNNLVVVGDDDQTIYSFNGADQNIILGFQKEFNAKHITLDTNYRSNTSILGLGNEIIKHNQNRYPKKLSATVTGNKVPLYIRPNTTDDEAEYVIRNIVSDVKNGVRNFRDFAILHRTGNSSRSIYDQLVLQDIPFVCFNNGDTFYEQSLVKPLLDHLRFSVNPKDIHALAGILPTLYLNRDQTLDYIQNQNLINPKDHLVLHLLNMPGIKPYQRQQMVERIRFILNMNKMSPEEAIQKMRIDFYDKYLQMDNRKNLTLHKEMMAETLDELESSAKRFTTIQNYLSFIEEIIEKNKTMEELRKNPNADAVSLMTIHKSKGLEFEVVYLIGASERILPHAAALEADQLNDMISDKKGTEKVFAAIEEECRLMYVAVTRAKEELYISSPSIYRNKTVEVSRFLMDVFNSPFS
ncbi:ATP-dependent helicase [Ammoniphilus resinae]|uniref:DNA 3'-5' helicase n=1 Tax=Ammoniphilus resinae TaxID=861532 RepID=A0ABS4GNN4_9BACL|nr:UvrD-helicase domain-containing protein [Ammoniphilus resinae]MBP1931879.1 DNA helicase-2/ATP-dependent DNA helicase PcrA [Ammoniphilus resinae]